MALKRIKEPYEVLIRFKDGVLSGAHIVDLETIKDGSEIIASRPLPARTLDLASAEYQAVIDSINLSLVGENEGLKKEKKELEKRIKDAEKELDKLKPTEPEA